MIYPELDKLKDLLKPWLWSRTWHYVQNPLTSTSFDGDAFSTTAKTVIDLSAVFGVPAGVRAVSVRLVAKDSGSAGSTTVRVGLGPTSGGALAVNVWVAGATNDTWVENSGICPCDANGDIYYDVVASGASTMDIFIQIFGYCY